MRRQSHAAWLVVAVTASLIVAACAASSRKTATTADAMAPPEGRFDAQKSDIAEMSNQIRGWRVELGLRVQPHDDMLRQFKHMPVSKLRLCDEDPRPNGAKCKDTCNIKDAICDNAEQICRIADELEGDDWAREKCDNAKASCKEATKKCCECASAEIEQQMLQQGTSANACGA